MSAAQAFGVLLLVAAGWLALTTPLSEILDRQPDTDRRERARMERRRQDAAAREWTRTGR